MPYIITFQAPKLNWENSAEILGLQINEKTSV